MLKAERIRKASIRQIRRENTKIEGPRGRRTLMLKVDHQYFHIGEMNAFNQAEARFMATQLAIALHRFKYGD